MASKSVVKERERGGQGGEGGDREVMREGVEGSEWGVWVGVEVEEGVKEAGKRRGVLRKVGSDLC